MLISRNTLKVFLFVLIFLMINAVLTFISKPYATTSSVMWDDFEKQNGIDTIFVGSSLVRRSINPYIIDKYTGSNSFCVSSTAQPYVDSYTSIRYAVEAKHIKNVYLIIDYSYLGEYINNGTHVAFDEALYKNASLEQCFKLIIQDDYFIKGLGLNRSLNTFVPWLYNHVKIDKPHILKNVKAKLNQNMPTQYINDSTSKYIGKGHAVFKNTLVVNYNQVGNEVYAFKFKENVNGNGLKNIGFICDYCKKKNIKLTAIGLPRTYFDILGYGERYFEIKDYLDRFFEEKGVAYFDFNLAKPSLFISKENYFKDYEHMNRRGSESFSVAMAKFMNLNETEKNSCKYFYNKEEFLNSIKNITIVTFDKEVKGKIINIKAKAFSGPSTKIEYRYLVKIPGAKKFDVFKEYTEDTFACYRGSTKGQYVIRVEARVAGSASAFEKYFERKISLK